MKIIELRHPYKKSQIPKEPIVLVLGFFDGVHKGHQKVIQTGRRIADEKGLKLAVMTFNQHPSIVFQKLDPEAMKYLTSVEQKQEHMASLKVDYLFVVEFTSSFAGLSPQDFISQYMIDWHADTVVAGFDYTYGPRDIATMANLKGFSEGRFDIVTVDKETLANEKVSSTRIRKALDEGKMEEANEMLNYTYETEGIVVHGDARGRTLGFPTANVKTKSTVRLPKQGVYVSEILIGDTWYTAMGSIGTNNTFEQNRPVTVELNILDFNQDIYGEQVRVRWISYLRDQAAYPSVEALVKQLNQDEADTRAYFKNIK